MATQTNRSMVSETSICNQALSWLGQNEIRSLSDKGDSAEWMRNNYPFLRDAVLEERMWTFATVKAVSTSQDQDAWGTNYIHPKPLNWISIFRCYRNVTNGNNQIDTSFRVEGEYIVSQWGTIYLWGIEQVTDTARFSPMFVQALAARIAADAATPLTENPQLQRDMWALYGDKLAQAAVRDGQQGANEVIESNSLINARAGVLGAWP